MKTCKGCGESREVEDFYRHPMMADGRLGFCKDCVKRRVKERRAANVEALRDYDRKRYYEQPHRGAEARWSSTRIRMMPLLNEVPEPYRKAPATPPRSVGNAARSAVARAVRMGRLTRQPCIACGGTPAHAHHYDYSRPLDVVWLCVPHHEAVHHGSASA